MELILKIAARNLFRHKGQSLVIGAILFTGALLMTFGNGVVTGMDRGLRKTIVNGFTGDLVLVSNGQAEDNAFLIMMGRAVEPIHGYPAIGAWLEKQPKVERALPIGKNMAMMVNEDEGMPTLLFVLGVDFERYARMFPGTLSLVEGRMPRPGGPGLLLPTGARKDILNATNIWFIPAGETLDTAHLEGDAKDHPGELSVKSDMVLMGFNEGNSTTDIRLPIDGIFRYRALNNIFGSFALMDIESYRQCLGYFTASERTEGRATGADSALLALEGGSLDAMFSEAPLIVDDRPGKADARPPAAPEPRAAAQSTASLDEGVYNMVLILLKDGADAEAAREEINAGLRREGLGVRAITWKQSLGPVGSMATLIKGALFVFVSFLFLVAVIIIINTLSMAALERTPEIGMMRAIGARRGQIAAIFLIETAMLALFFGGLGVAAGAAAVEIVSLARITSDNDMLQLFFGGDTFRPALAAEAFALAFLQLAMTTAAAVAYPLRLARRVTPLQAVYKE